MLVTCVNVEIFSETYPEVLLVTQFPPLDFFSRAEVVRIRDAKHHIDRVDSILCEVKINIIDDNLYGSTAKYHKLAPYLGLSIFPRQARALGLQIISISCIHLLLL